MSTEAGWGTHQSLLGEAIAASSADRRHLPARSRRLSAQWKAVRTHGGLDVKNLVFGLAYRDRVYASFGF